MASPHAVASQLNPPRQANLAGVYILNGEQKEADKLLISEYGTTEIPDQLLVQIYSKTRDYERLAGIWRAFVKINSKNLEYRKNLSGAYLLANQKRSAIETLEAAIKDFPEFKSEGENLIKDIKK